MIGDDPVDYEQAQKLLEQRRAQMQQPQGPMAQSGGSFSSAMDTISKYQGQQSQRDRPQMPADEAPPKEDNAKTYWAMALSLLGGGRDLGSVLQSSADNYNKRLSAWEARNSPDAKLDRSMKLAQLEQMQRAPQREALDQGMRLAGIEQGDRGQQIQQQQFALTQDQQLFMKQADEIYDRAKQKAMFNNAGEMQANAQAHSEKLAFAAQHGMDERHVSEMENQREMQRQRIEAENARNEQDNAVRLGVASLSSQNKLPVAIPGTRVTDQARYNSLLPGQREKADEVAMNAVQMNQHLQQLQDVILQPRSSSNKNTYQSLLLELVGDANKANSAGVVNGQEFVRTVQNFPDYTSTKDALGKLQQMKGPLATIEVLRGENPVLSTLSKLQNMHAQAFNAKSRLYGFELDGAMGGPQAQPEQAQQTGAPPPQAAPQAQPAPQQAIFDPVKSGMKGKWQAVQPEPAAQTPAPQPSREPAYDAQPVGMSVQQPQASMSMKPMRKGGQVKMPTSIQEARQLEADGWSML